MQEENMPPAEGEQEPEEEGEEAPGQPAPETLAELLAVQSQFDCLTTGMDCEGK